jgi:hypothetical protein
LGTLEKEYGSDAYYVHLLRRRDEVARSIIDRGEDSIIFSFASGILQHYHRARTLPDAERFEIGLQYWDTVNDNIQLFLRDKPRQITVWLHDIKAPFWRFWTEIGAEGDLNAALEEWDIRHNPRKTVPIGWTSVERGVETAQHQLSTIVPPGRKFILIDDDQDTPIGSLAGRTRIPFLENHGRYWGPPANDDIAVSELGRMRESGVQYIAFTHPGLWWLNYYSRFNAHLRSEYHCAFEGRGLIVFDLDRGAE